MEFNEAKCPKCGGVLQVPEGLEKLICMYCGREIQASELIRKEVHQSHDVCEATEKDLLNRWEKKDDSVIELATKLLDDNRFSYAPNYILAMQALPRLVTDHLELKMKFKREQYEEVMKEYIESARPKLEYLERACVIRESERRTILDTAADHMVQEIAQAIKDHADSHKEKQEFVMEDYKMVLVLFTIPMILELRLDISEEFADKIVEAWRTVFPKSNIRKGYYENISNGFRKRGFCYITTAVCESLQKEDDCYELTMFRNFRDNYLLQQKEGKRLIEQYYVTAPLIVEQINLQKDRESLYQAIWRDHLSGCLSLIEAGNDEACMKEYIHMVNQLQDKYEV